MPYKLALPEAITSKTIDIDLTFMGNYQEPNLHLKVLMEELVEHGEIEYEMVFDCQTENWELVLMHNKNKDMIGVGEFTTSSPPTEPAEPEKAA